MGIWGDRPWQTPSPFRKAQQQICQGSSNYWWCRNLALSCLGLVCNQSHGFLKAFDPDSPRVASRLSRSWLPLSRRLTCCVTGRCHYLALSTLVNYINYVSAIISQPGCMLSIYINLKPTPCKSLSGFHDRDPDPLLWRQNQRDQRIVLGHGFFIQTGQSRTINFAQARHNFNVFYITSGILPNDKAEASGIALSVGGGYLFTRAKSVQKKAEDTVKKST